MTRRKLVTGLLGAAAAAAYPYYVEPRWLQLSETRLQLPRASWQRALRILHLSDLHASSFVPWRTIEHAFSLGLAAQPDIICLTGDFVTAGDDCDFPKYTRALRRLSSTAPTLAVLGNHDGGAWTADRGGLRDHRRVDRLLGDSGVELLHNRSTRVATQSGELTLVGAADLWSDEMDGPTAFRGVDQWLPTILLAHNPDSKDELSRYPWDLMLSGHTHGGQVRIPFAGSYYVPVIDKRYVAGLKPWGARQIYVTRGVGNIYGVRFRCRPEVSLLLIS